MTITIWGTRGSLASPGALTARYGGNTSCVEIRGDDGTVLALDAGTGIRQMGLEIPASARRVDILLTHLHVDHIQGLGFFKPLFDSDVEAHIWGPASTTADLWGRLTRYLSPPLFPVHLRDLPCSLHLHEVPCGDFSIGEFRISSSLVCHPGPTVGYRIEGPGGVATYLPDHEPALGLDGFPSDTDWISGYALAADADLLIHDGQYTSDEYKKRIGWGHSSIDHLIEFAGLARVKQLVPFHHDPMHTDDDLDQFFAEAVERMKPSFVVTPAMEGEVIRLQQSNTNRSLP